MICQLDKYFTVIDTPSGVEPISVGYVVKHFSDADDAGWHYMETCSITRWSGMWPPVNQWVLALSDMLFLDILGNYGLDVDETWRSVEVIFCP